MGSLHVQAQGETPLSKEQEAELMQQTLAALGEMRIRYPGKSEEEAEAVLDEVSYAAERKRSVRAGEPAALFPLVPRTHLRTSEPFAESLAVCRVIRHPPVCLMRSISCLCRNTSGQRHLFKALFQHSFTHHFLCDQSGVHLHINNHGNTAFNMRSTIERMLALLPEL